MNIQLPIGVADILPQDYALKNWLCSQIGTVCRRSGYRGVSPPLFERADVFMCGSVAEDKIYKFIDKNGEAVALRPDVTPQIARIAAGMNEFETYPLRLYYTEHVYRCSEHLQESRNELLQAGAELYGVSSANADAEILSLAVASLLAAGLLDFRINISDVRFIASVLEGSGLSDAEQRRVRNLIIKKDYISVADVVQGANIPECIARILCDPAQCIGDISLLDECEAVVGATAKTIIKNLRDVYEILALTELNKYVFFDLSLTGRFDYYTGIVMRGYATDVLCPVVEGGRYDNICSRFGEDISAVGFAINVNELATALKNDDVEFTYPFADTLVAWSPAMKKQALTVAEQLRGGGLYAENSIIDNDFDNNIAYAKKRGLSGILYFSEDGTILHDIKTGATYNLQEP